MTRKKIDPKKLNKMTPLEKWITNHACMNSIYGMSSINLNNERSK